MIKERLPRLAFINLNVLNIIDCIITISIVSYYDDLTIEANPIMKYFLEMSPAYFAIIKIGMVLLFSSWLYHQSKKRLARFGLYFLSFVYVFVIGYWLFCFANV